MAIVKFAVVTGREISGSLDYITADEKTLAELKTGINCQVQTAGDEMLAVQKAYGKTDGRRLVHIIQSFHPKDPVTIEQAHKIGIEFAAQWPDYQIVVATHLDKEHLHNHFIMNSVRVSDGKKFHQTAKELAQVKEFSNKLCAERGLKICLLKNPNNTSAISKEEYQVAVKGGSWKMQLLNIIDNAMKKSGSREEFIRNIKAQGYDMRWEDNYKYLTYFCPNNKKCRDIKLHDIRYLKERMEREFEIRRTQALEQASGTGAAGGIFYDNAQRPYQNRELFFANQQPTNELGAENTTAASDTTGWETERETYFTQAFSSAENTNLSGVATAADVARGIVGGAVKIGRAMERAQNDVPLTPPQGHIDSKRYKKLAEKKQAQGQKMSNSEGQEQGQSM